VTLDVESLVVGATVFGAVIGSGVAGFKLIMRYVGNGGKYNNSNNDSKVKTLPCPYHSGFEAKLDAMKDRLTGIEGTLTRIFDKLDRRIQ